MNQAMIQSMKTEFALGVRREARRHAALAFDNRARKAVSPLRSATAVQNLAAMLLCVLALVSSSAHAATNNLTALLQQGLFEEEANHNLDAAITAYQSLVNQFDKDRKLAATAVFRLGECYRKLGNTNAANAQYQRVLKEFSDQTALVAAIQNYSQRPPSTQGKRIHIQSGAQPEADSGPQTFNIDFGPAGEPSKQVGPAAAGREGDFWNTVGPATPFSNVHTESGLKFANGQPCPIEAELINLGGSWGNEGRMGVKAPMYDTFNYPFNNQGGNSRVFLYHVPAGTYDLYLYGHSALQTYYGDYEVTVGGRDYGRKKTSADGDAIENIEWVEGSQYVRFPSVKVADGDRVEILIRPGAQQTLQTTFPPAPLRSPFYGPKDDNVDARKKLGTPFQSFDRPGDIRVDDEMIKSLEKHSSTNAAHVRTITEGPSEGPVRTITRTFADAMICGLQLVPSGE